MTKVRKSLHRPFKAYSLPVAEKLASVVIDEIALKKHISYDARSDLFEGFVAGAASLTMQPKCFLRWTEKKSSCMILLLSNPLETI